MRRNQRRVGSDLQDHVAPSVKTPAAPKTAQRRLLSDVDAAADPAQPGSALPTSPDIVNLQRIIGNRALQRRLGFHRRSNSGAPMPPLPATPQSNMPPLPATPQSAMPPLPATPQSNMPPLPATPQPDAPGRPALPAPGTVLSSVMFEAQILAHAQTPHRLGGQRAAAAAILQGDQLAKDRAAILKPIMTVYRAYEADPSLANMIKLHNKIDQWRVMYWEQSTLRDVGFRTKGIREILDNTSMQVERRVREETAKSGVSSDNATDAVLDAGKEKQKPVKPIKFFEDVGVAPAYYAKLTSEQVKAFKYLYDTLKKNKPKQLGIAIQRLESMNIVGFSLIKGLFLTRFPKVAGIDHFQRTDYAASKETKEAAFRADLAFSSDAPQDRNDQYYKDETYAPIASSGKELENLGGLKHGKGMTPAELNKLNDYTGGGYEVINPRLRNTNYDVEQGSLAALNQVDSLNKASVVVSALNKLPQYKGVAYRMQNSFAGFEDAVKPGGKYTDLAFMSASKTQEGAEIGGTSGGKNSGALEIYMIIRSKTAAQLSFLSSAIAETEVLFRPGTRFNVDAVWEYQNGKIPNDAPQEAKMILARAGETKSAMVGPTGKQVQVTGKVRVIEMTET